jgi:hypothetical protein
MTCTKAESRRCSGTLVFLLASLWLAGCSTTSLTDSWQAPTFRQKDMDDVLVVAVTGNASLRIPFEEGFVKALRDRGIRTTASHSVIGDRMPNRESVTAYVEQNAITHVIVTDYGGTQVSKWVVPESVRTYYTGPYYPTYRGYWDGYGNTVTMTRESYVDERKTVMLSTSIFDTATGELVWVGRSQSLDPASIAAEANALARKMVNTISN